MRWFLAAFYLLATTACNTALAENLDVQLALGGYARSDAVIEMRIAPNSPSAQLRAAGAAPNMILELPKHDLNDEPIAIPLFIHDSTQSLLLTGTSGSGTSEKSLLLRPVPAGNRLVVSLLADITLLGSNSISPDKITLVHAAPSDMPQLTMGYAQVDGLVLDEMSLAKLTTRQLDALEVYLGQCGPVATYGVAEAVLASLRDSAGCQGKSVKATNTLSPLNDWIKKIRLRQLFVSPPSFSITHATMNNLLQTYSATLIGFFFVTCLLVVLFYRRIEGAIVVSLVSTLLLVFHWGAASHRMSLISVSTFAAGASQGVLFGNVSTDGLYRDLFEWELPKGAVFMEKQGDVTLATTHRDKPAGVTMLTRTSLNSHSEASFFTDVVSTGLPILLLAQTHPGVRNSDTGILHGAMLVVAGMAYAVPDLKPNEEWILSEASPPVSLPKWIQRQLVSDDIGIVLPHQPALINSMLGVVQSENWAIVKAAQSL